MQRSSRRSGGRGRGIHRGRGYSRGSRGRAYRGRGRGRGRPQCRRCPQAYVQTTNGTHRCSNCGDIWRPRGRGRARARGRARGRGRPMRGRGRGKVKVDPSKWVTTQFLYDSKNNVNKKSSSSSFGFAKCSFAYFGQGGIVERIKCNSSKSNGQSVYISWLIGKSTGNGKILFEGDGSALLGVEILKNCMFGDRKLQITDPKKAQNEKDGIYEIELSNLPLHFDNETLTKTLGKLHLENVTESNIIYNCNISNYQANPVVATQLKSLLNSYNLIELKCKPAKNGICSATAILKSMDDCLKLIREKNNQFIDFGVEGGKITIKFDLRTVIELEPAIWDILRPKIQRLWSIIRFDPLQFYGIKVFLIPIQKSQSSTDKARIVIVGTDPKTVILARNLYDKLTKPLIFKYDSKSKCRLIYKYLKTKQFTGLKTKDFPEGIKCCAIQIFIQSNTIKIYATYDTKNIFKSKIQQFENNITCHNIINITPFIIRKCLLPKMKEIMKYGEYGVYVNMDLIKRLVQIIYCKKVILDDVNDDDMKNDDDNKYNKYKTYTDKHFIESDKKGKECIKYIEKILKEFKESKVFIKPKSDSNSTLNCGICTMDIEENEEIYKLKLCQHTFHSDCIEMQLNSGSQSNGTRPIQCASCNQNISLKDIKYILKDDSKYEQLLQYSIKDNVKINPDKYRYCSTPDCKQIYLLNSNENDDEKQQINDNIFSCTECLKQYCLNCNIEYHFGMSCKQYDLSNNGDNDESLKEFLNKYNADNATQNCPNCGIVTDKLPNTCNHAKCEYCNAHFCWNCTWMDENNNKDGNLVYKHMQSEHGGYYG